MVSDGDILSQSTYPGRASPPTPPRVALVGPDAETRRGQSSGTASSCLAPRGLRPRRAGVSARTMPPEEDL